MILARISRAIREQNWFAVALEFVIVIAGVVIGFQVTEYASARTEAEQRAIVIDRLHDEVESAISILVLITDRYEELNTARTELIELILADADLDRLDTDINRTAAASTRFLPAFSPQQGVYTEIVSSGMLSSLGDTPFREALGDYQASVIFLQDQIGNYLMMSTTRASIADFDYVRMVYVPGNRREGRSVIDWEAASNDPEFLQFLLAGQNQMLAIGLWWQGALESARALCAETGRLTERPCEPPPAPAY